MTFKPRRRATEARQGFLGGGFGGGGRMTGPEIMGGTAPRGEATVDRDPPLVTDGEAAAEGLPETGGAGGGAAVLTGTA